MGLVCVAGFERRASVAGLGIIATEHPKVLKKTNGMCYNIARLWHCKQSVRRALYASGLCFR
jgi:hypothetical protein